MAQISLADALERVDSTGVKDRVEALADLKHVLRHNQRSSSIESLADASFHRIYEVLFKIIVSEQSAYAKAKTAPLKSGAANRLSACAGVLRLAVEVGVGSVKLKTVKALLDHFIETIPLISPFWIIWIYHMDFAVLISTKNNRMSRITSNKNPMSYSAINDISFF